MQRQAVEGYRAELAKLLEAKDPRSSGGKLARGSVLFVFPGEHGEAPERITVQIDDSTVRVLPGAQSLEGRPVALIRAPLAAWLAFSAAPSAEARAAISLYGEFGLLESLSAMVSVRRSAVSARCFALPALNTQTRRKRKSHVHYSKNQLSGSVDRDQ